MSWTKRLRALAFAPILATSACADALDATPKRDGAGGETTAPPELDAGSANSPQRGGGARDAALRNDAASPRSEGPGERSTRPDDSGAGDPEDAARPSDAATSGEDAGVACRAFVMPSDCAAPNGTLPRELRCTGLYGDWDTRELACGVLEYKPAFELWSDGAHKRRFVSLPPNATIDVRDPQGFVYPVGTQFWKEFRIQGASGEELGETRLLRKSERGWLYTSYVWSEGAQTAQANDQGIPDLRQTGHSVPSREQCKTCHSGRADFVLGWDWLLLGPGATGVTREQLLARGLLVAAGRTAELPTDAELPGDEIERAALGYLHVNCGVSCHNDTPRGGDDEAGQLRMRLELGELASVLDTDVARSGINHAPNPIATAILWGAQPAGGFYDFRPGDPQRSYALARTSVRGLLRQMPRLASNRVDEAGVRILSDWIEHMTPERGYPAPAP